MPFNAVVRPPPGGLGGSAWGAAGSAGEVGLAVVRDARALAGVLAWAGLGVADGLGDVDLVRLAGDCVALAGALLVAEVVRARVVAVVAVGGRVAEVALRRLEALLDALAAFDQGPVGVVGGLALLAFVLGPRPADAAGLARGRGFLAAQQRVLGGPEVGVHAGPLAVFVVRRHAGDVPARLAGESRGRSAP